MKIIHYLLAETVKATEGARHFLRMAQKNLPIREVFPERFSALKSVRLFKVH